MYKRQIFTGSVHEPIKGTKNPQKMLQTGIPFTKKPVALQFDYKGGVGNMFYDDAKLSRVAIVEE